MRPRPQVASKHLQTDVAHRFESSRAASAAHRLFSVQCTWHWGVTERMEASRRRRDPESVQDDEPLAHGRHPELASGSRLRFVRGPHLQPLRSRIKSGMTVRWRTDVASNDDHLNGHRIVTKADIPTRRAPTRRTEFFLGVIIPDLIRDLSVASLETSAVSPGETLRVCLAGAAPCELNLPAA